MLDNPTEQEVEGIKLVWQEAHEKVLLAGGLHIIGSERHESRRIDNQLRGRSGRQGDPIFSLFLSLEDDLTSAFSLTQMRSIMQSLGMQRGEAIEHKMVTNAIEKAQKKLPRVVTSIWASSYWITMMLPMISGHKSMRSAMN